MKIIERYPTGQLSKYVKRISIIEEDSGYNVCVPAFPVGYAYINVLTGSRFAIEKDRSQLTTHSYICGQTLTPFTLRMKFIERSLLLQLQPWGINALLPYYAHEMYDAQTPLDLVDRQLAAHLEDLVHSPLPSLEVLEQVQALLLRQLREQDTDIRVTRAWGEIYRQQGHISVKELSANVNISVRRLQQLFRESIGISPKGYCRIVRVQHFTHEAITTGYPDQIPDVYFDQAHFIHDVKSQTNMTPAQYAEFLAQSPHRMAYLKSSLFSQFR